MKVKVLEIETNKILEWDIEDILEEINRDRSDEWSAYDCSDWMEGWKEWVEPSGFLKLVDKTP